MLVHDCMWERKEAFWASCSQCWCALQSIHKNTRTCSHTAEASGTMKPGIPHWKAALRAPAALLAAMSLQASCSAAALGRRDSSSLLASWSFLSSVSSCTHV